ncbi:MAG: hypothetical protein IT425_00770 [Pirellulales bacterium]|nr:hypothetical protein [Pirellulales bacterium]
MIKGASSRGYRGCGGRFSKGSFGCEFVFGVSAGELPKPFYGGVTVAKKKRAAKKKAAKKTAKKKGAKKKAKKAKKKTKKSS